MLLNALRKRSITQANSITTLRATLAQARYFSTDASDKKPDYKTHTQEEIEKGRQEWGIKYDDECLKFEKEWKAIAEAVEERQATYIESELGDLQKKKVEMLADKLLDLNIFEQRYL